MGRFAPEPFLGGGEMGVRKREALALRQVRFAGLHDVEDIMGSIESQYETEEGDNDPASLVIALRRPPQRPDGYFKGAPLRAVVIRALLSLGVAMEHCEEGFRSATRWCTSDPVCTLASPIRALGKVGGSTARCVSPVARITWGVASAAARAVRLATRKVEGAGEACSHAAEITERVTGYGS